MFVSSFHGIAPSVCVLVKQRCGGVRRWGGWMYAFRVCVSARVEIGRSGRYGLQNRWGGNKYFMRL